MAMLKADGKIQFGSKQSTQLYHDIDGTLKVFADSKERQKIATSVNTKL